MFDTALFLQLNFTASTPANVLALARFASEKLPEFMLVAALAVGVAGQRPWRVQAWRVLASVALAALITRVLKRLFDMPRPFMLELGTQWLPHGASASFPSAHATGAMAFAISACLASLHGPWRWPVRALLLGAALLVSWSRVALGLHFPSDVLAGWCVGAVAALAVQALTQGGRPWAKRSQKL